MYRFLQIGDQHFDSVAPSSRKDDYLKALQAKVHEIRELAISLRVTAVLWMGDLIHKQDSHRVAYGLTNWLIDYFKSYPPGIRNLVAMGNHDVKQTVGNWDRQPLGTLVKAGCITPMWSSATPENLTGATQVVLGDVVIHGKLFDYDADKPECRPIYYRVDKTGYEQHFHIMMCHSALFPDGQTFFGHWTNPMDLVKVVPREVAPDLYLCGHVHDDLGEFAAYHVQCMNPGALSRGSIDEFNIQRTVKVGYIEVERHVDSSYRCKLSTIPLQSARPAEEIFYLQEFKQKKQRTAELDRLAEMLKQGTVADQFSLVKPEQAMEVVLRSRSVSPQAEALVRQYVAAARQELG